MSQIHFLHFPVFADQWRASFVTLQQSVTRLGHVPRKKLSEQKQKQRKSFPVIKRFLRHFSRFELLLTGRALVGIRSSSNVWAFSLCRTRHQAHFRWTPIHVDAKRLSTQTKATLRTGGLAQTLLNKSLARAPVCFHRTMVEPQQTAAKQSCTCRQLVKATKLNGCL